MALAERPARYTVADYMAWEDEVPPCELIGGVPYAMTPAPNLRHEQVTVAVLTGLQEARREREGGSGSSSPCRLFTAPVDVVLAADTVVQPDLLVVCDPAKLANGQYVDGAPDLVVEVLSPRTAAKDKREKLQLYERAGVPEYLIVDPLERYVEYYRLGEDGGYGRPGILAAEDNLELRVFPGHALCVKGWLEPV